MDLNQAIAAHAEWKIKFRSAMAKQETVDVAAASKDNCCTLGKWLYAEGKQQYCKHGSYTDLVLKHAEFHRQVGRIAQFINDKQYAKATAELDGPAYNNASKEVITAIGALRRAAA